MRRLRTTKRFERDLERVGKRGKPLNKLWSVVDRLLTNEPLEARHRTHSLTEELQSFRACHIEPDWLLIWREAEDQAVLV